MIPFLSGRSRKGKESGTVVPKEATVTTTPAKDLQGVGLAEKAREAEVGTLEPIRTAVGAEDTTKGAALLYALSVRRLATWPRTADQLYPQPQLQQLTEHRWVTVISAGSPAISKVTVPRMEVKAERDQHVEGLLS